MNISTIGRGQARFNLVLVGKPSNNTTTSSLEDFLANLPANIDDEDPFMASETFAFERRRKLIKKQTHK